MTTRINAFHGVGRLACTELLCSAGKEEGTRATAKNHKLQNNGGTTAVSGGGGSVWCANCKFHSKDSAN